jgi:23S rRNA A2030 N6-methylase RlmJ
VTDLRDQLEEFEAAARRLVHERPARCHPGRPVLARGLCRRCYWTAWTQHTLDEHPSLQRSRQDFVADYRLLRSEGYTRTQIAERLGMKRAAVAQAYRRATLAGDLEPDRRAA